MTSILPTRRRAMRHLLLCSAGSVLAAAPLLSPVQAQVAGIQVSGARTLVNDQANHGAATRVDAGGAAVSIATGALQGGDASIADNSISAAARGNQVTQSLATDGLDPVSGDDPASLSAGIAGVTANAAAVIASRQSNAGSPVESDTSGAGVALDAGAVSDSRLGVSRNTQEAIALGNDASVSLTQDALSGTGSAGIVSLQTTDQASGVAARSLGRSELASQAVSGSALTVTDNLERAIAYGNSVGNSLSAKALDVAAATDAEIGSVVPADGSGDPGVSAAFGVLSNQVLGGSAEARGGDPGGAPAFGAIIAGDFAASSLINDRNALVAAGYGNQSSNALDLQAGSIGSSGAGVVSGLGTVAQITGVQRIADANVAAATLGAAVSHVFGDIADATLSASQNSVGAVATGNLAEGNLLTVRANAIETSGASGGAPGTALVGADGGAVNNAAFGVQNVQDYGHGTISAAADHVQVGLVSGGTVIGATLRADNNLESAGATGNNAVNGATLQAIAMDGGVAVNNLQTGDGDVLASLGRADLMAGAIVAPFGQIVDSSLSVTGNALAATATGNSGSNSLAVTADTLAGGNPQGAAQAGPLEAGYGAVADFALANNQKLGEPSVDGSATPAITSAVYGHFAVTGDGTVEGSSISVDGNRQNAAALGNTALNRVVVSATGLAGDGSLAAGAALSSAQYGEAQVSALSVTKTVTKGAVAGSTTSISGNTNQALAAINQVDNGLSVEAAQLADGAGGDAQVATGALGSGGATGDNVLTNVQFATGRADATARTRLLDSDAGGGLTGSGFVDQGNVTSAEASANQALNSVAITAASGGQGGVGLASSQMSVADVTASAVTNALYSVAGSAALPAVDASSVTVADNVTSSLARGNVADNALSVTGGAGVPSAAPEAVVGRYDATLHAAAALLNSQSNYGAVTATAADTAYGAPLNATGLVTGSSIGVTGNNASAGAYGNAASNVVTVAGAGQLPTAAVANVQANYGPVAAQVTGASYRIIAGPVSAGALSITGNHLAAAATGNQATSTISSAR